MAATTRITITYKAFDGVHFAVVVHVSGDIIDPDNEVVLAVVAFVNACTNCVAIHVEVSRVGAAVGTVTASATYIAEDKAFFRFKDDFGTAHNYRIPGPLPAIFMATGLQKTELVNVADSDVIAFVGAVEAHAIGRGGNPVGTFVKAYRKENQKGIKAGAV